MLKLLKKIATISLLLLFLFNWFGYRIISNYYEHRSDVQLEATFDQEQYNSNDLVSIKIPSNVPYYTGTAGFERADGEVEMNGVRYKYVKRRIFKDSLELLCIADYQKKQLQQSRDDFFKSVNDLQHNSSGKKQDNGFAKNSLSEYCWNVISFQLTPPAIQRSVLSLPGDVTLIAVSRSPQEQPPDATLVSA